MHSAGADDFILRDRQLHVIDAEVGEELGRIVILVAIPGSMPPHAYFGKPLAAEHEITLPSGTGLGLGKLGLKCDLELDIRARRDRLSQLQVNHGLVIFVAIVGRDELQLRSQISLAHHFDALDVFRAVILVFPLLVASVAAAHELGVATNVALGWKAF